VTDAAVVAVLDDNVLCLTRLRDLLMWLGITDTFKHPSLTRAEYLERLHRQDYCIA
jgi:hypothetical protein